MTILKSNLENLLLEDLDDVDIRYILQNLLSALGDKVIGTICLYDSLAEAGEDDSDNSLREEEDDEEWGEFLCGCPDLRYTKLPSGKVLYLSL